MAADTKRGAVQWISVGTGNDYFIDVSVGEVEHQLARLGLHVVTAADKAVLDACAALDLRTHPTGLVTCYGGHRAVELAELARREAAK